MRDYTALHQQWLEKYHDQINSGESITFWCKESNIKYQSFCYRLRRLQQLWLIVLSKNSSAFIEIKATINHSIHSTSLENGNCDVSNNTVENAIRPFVIGRKNYLFHITDKGAGISAGYYSLVETAKANGLDPQKYFEWIFTELPNIRPKTEKKQLERLLPWSNKVPESCKANTIETLRNQNS